MADMSALLDRYFKADSLDEPRVLTVKEVVAEVVKSPDGNTDQKPVLYVEEDPRGLILNGTRYDAFALAAGSRDTDKWVGLKFELSVDPDIKFGGRKVGGLAVRI